MRTGKYIVFEGVVGTGKTTQSKLLAGYLRERFPDREIVWTREPGGSEIAEAIRTVVQGTPFTESMNPISEAYLFAAARAQSLRTAVLPVLERGGIVISDRSFLSSLAFQGGGRGLGSDLVLKINTIAIEGSIPDAVIFLDMPVSQGVARAHDARGDKFESLPLDFAERCADGYRAMANFDFLRGRWQTVNATKSIDEVFADILKAVSPILTP